MSEYKCPNPDCEETWDISEFGALIIPNYKDDYWFMKKDEFLIDCPSCSNDWLLSDFRTTSGLCEAISKIEIDTPRIKKWKSRLT